MPYIQPITKIHSSFDEAKESFDKDSGIVWTEEEGITGLGPVLEAPRNLIVGEPGIGKTLMLEKMLEQLHASGVVAARIELRTSGVAGRLRDLLDADSKPSVLLLDGLDEIPAKERREVMQSLAHASTEHPDVSLHISGRWVFVRRYAQYFQNFRFISIARFTRSQARSFLAECGHPESDIRELLEKMSLGRLTSIIQVPRYLVYLQAYLEDRGVEAAAAVSRNELFEYFIYQKLELEEEKLDTNKRALVKRVLEKLALAMEICQTNVITKDELMTFFDELDSDLKLVALSQVPVEVLYDYSLLRVSSESLEQLEFENTEFQEYLAARELSRFADPGRSAFALATDPRAHEIYPSWYNTLAFLVDMQPDLLEQLVEFSGLRRHDYKIVDEGFFHFLSLPAATTVPEHLRSGLFRDVIDYHTRMLQWVSYRLTEALAAFFEPSLEQYLQEQVAIAESVGAETNVAARRHVPLANIAYVIAGLLRSGATIDRSCWRDKLIAYAKGDRETGVLQRHALRALAELGDSSVLEELTELPLGEELVVRALVETCIELDPNHPTTLQHVFNLVARGDVHGREGLYRLTAPQAIEAFLRRFLDDDGFRRGFLRGVSIFGEEDAAIAERIDEAATADICELAKHVLLASFQPNVVYEYHVSDSHFFRALWHVMRDGDPAFVADMIKRIKSGVGANLHLFYASPLLAAVLEVDDVASFIGAMRDVGEESAAMRILDSIKDSNRPTASEIYEAGRQVLPERYRESEKAEDARSHERALRARQRTDEVLAHFRTLLEPEPGKFSGSAFEYYNQHCDELGDALSEADRRRLLEILTETVLERWDPGEHELTIAHEGGKTFTTNAAVFVFSEAIETARHLGLDLGPYRQQVLNLIPFAYHSELELIFEAVPNVAASEFEPVLEIYRRRDSDLWRHRPESLVAAVKRYSVTAAASLLKALVTEDAIDSHAREQALVVLDSLAPDAAFSREVFERYAGSEGETRKLAEIANATLITSHRDSTATEWRLQQVIERAAPFDEPRGAHFIGALEDEIRLKRTFARPLMLAKEPGYEENYLSLIDKGIELWGRGPAFHAYAEYLWNIAFAYFDNLAETGYAPLERLENRLAKARDSDGTNLLAMRLVGLRRKYLGYLGPKNIADAVHRFNEVRQYSDRRISNAEELFHHVREVLRTDVRRYIEGEGGHRFLSRATGDREDFGQKALKAQIETFLGRRGFWVDVTREPQLLDDRRVDFLVRYGFVGPVLIELKLTSNRDLKRRSLDEAQSYVNMRQYMEGFNAPHGIFLVIDNEGASNLEEIDATYGAIPNVHVEIFRCAPLEAE
jgi:hypothetical protein